MTTNLKTWSFRHGGGRVHSPRGVIGQDTKQGCSTIQQWAAALAAVSLTAAASAQSLQEALDNNLDWATGGASAWSGQTSYTRDGVDAAWSGWWLGDNQESWIETTVQGPGVIWFWWKVSSETNYDFLTFTVNGQTNAAISGEVDWQQLTNALPAGLHVLRWTYSKDKALARGQDRGFLDMVAFLTPAAVIVTQPEDVRQRQGSTVTLSVGATGDLLTYQWRRDGQPLPDATNATLVLSNILATQSGFYDVVVTNIHNAVTSRLAKVDIYVPLPMPTRSTNVGLVVGWGDNSYGQLNAPADLTNAVAVAAGGSFSIGLRSDGRVTGWGSSANCELCIPSDLNDVVTVAAGGNHALALREDGTVAAWGNNWHCQTCVPVGLSNVVSVAAGAAHSLALRDDGTVVAWGYNATGQTDVPTNLSDVVAIAAGSFHSLALRRNGRVVAWGYNAQGQTNVPNDLANVVAVAPGSQSYASIALKRDGTVVAWGESSVANIPPGLNRVKAIAAGGGFGVALKQDGTATTWGNWDARYAGVPPTYNNLLAVAAGSSHVLAVVSIPLVGPSDVVAPEGGAASFAVLAQGPGSFSYRWYFNGAELLGETNATLTLSNVSLSQAGSYSVRVWSDQRQALSRPAKLVVTPRNDAFSQRLVAGGGGGRFYSSTTDASWEPGEPNHANAYGGRSIWYEWTAPVNGSLTVDTIGSTFDTVLAVYTGAALGQLELVAVDDDGANFNRNSRLTFDCRAGVTYLIAVDGFLGASGAVILNLTPVLAIPEAAALADGSFGLGIFAPAGQSVVLEASTNLRDWTAIRTNAAPPEGALRMSLPAATHSLRFYRARLKGP